MYLCVLCCNLRNASAMKRNDRPSDEASGGPSVEASGGPNVEASGGRATGIGRLHIQTTAIASKKSVFSIGPPKHALTR